jgi:uncharacterized membrane protein YqjE
MADIQSTSPGLFKSFRTVLARLLATFQTRAALFSVELQEERYRLIELLLLTGGALLLSGIALLLLSITVILVFPPHLRVYAALALVVLYAAGAAVLVRKIKRKLRDEPFSETIDQLKKDWECLTPPQ